MSLSRRRFLPLLAACGAPSRAAFAFPPYLVGASADVRGLDYFETMDLLRRIGFRTVEVQENNRIDAACARTGRSERFCLNNPNQAERERIRHSVDGFDHVTIHLPWTRLNYGGYAGSWTEDSVLVMEEGLRVGGMLGAKLAVIHFRPGDGLSSEEAAPVLVRRIRHWGDMARDLGMRLAVETGTPPSVKDFVRLIHTLDHDNVGATLDVGHQRGDPELSSRVKPEDRAKPESIRAYNDVNIWLVEQLGQKLFHLHIHDIEPETWHEHQPLIHGFIDYPRLLGKLRQMEYRGVLVFEIGPMAGMEPMLRDARRKLEAWVAATGSDR